MRVGIISDTHGHVELTRPAVRMFESLGVERVFHCGDIGSMAVVELFAAWPAHFVFGNCDEDTEFFAAAIHEAGQTCHGLFGDLEFDGVKVALLHSHERRRFRDAIDGEGRGRRPACRGCVGDVDGRLRDGQRHARICDRCAAVAGIAATRDALCQNHAARSGRRRAARARDGDR